MSESSTFKTADERQAAATRHAIPRVIKHRGRWCFLRQVCAGMARYSANAKQMRTAFRQHRPVEVTLDFAAARAVEG